MTPPDSLKGLAERLGAEGDDLEGPGMHREYTVVLLRQAANAILALSEERDMAHVLEEKYLDICKVKDDENDALRAERDSLNVLLFECSEERQTIREVLKDTETQLALNDEYATKEVNALRSENARLRAVVEAARAYLDTSKHWHIGVDPTCEVCPAEERLDRVLRAALDVGEQDK